MAQDLSTRIASRADTLVNWTSTNPVLLKGEIAIVFDNNNQLFKVGDGTSHFEDLPYSFYDQFASEEIDTSLLKAKNISQGYASEISGIGGIATGYKSQVSANFAQAHGYQAMVSSDFGYVWNGDNTDASYADHGKGTYNINPAAGISGVYIGDSSLADMFRGRAKVSVDSQPTEDLKLLHISYDDYAQLVADDNVDPHTIYVLSAEGYDDQYGNRIANVGSPISADDAATKGYVDEKASDADLLIAKNATNIATNARNIATLAAKQTDIDISAAAFSSRIKHVEDDTDEVKHQLSSKVDKVIGKGLSQNDFTDAYKQKVDTAATKQYVDEQISAISAPDLSEYYKKTETSSATEISDAFDAISLSNYVKLSSETTQNLKTDLSIAGFVAIGAATVQTSPDANYIRYDAPQAITNTQKQQLATNGGYRLQLVNLTGSVQSGYLTFQLEDYAVNCIEITSNSYPVKIILPDIVDTSTDVKRAREFIVKVKVTTSTPPSCTFVKSSSDTSVGFEADNEYWQDLYSGVNLFTFKETERA